MTRQIKCKLGNGYWLRYVTGILVALAAFPSVLMCQAILGGLSGVVTDSTGAVVQKAKVVLRDQGTNEKRSMTTTSGGEYSFVSLPPGTYEVAVQGAGFGTVITNDIVVTSGETARQDVKLDVGSVTAVVSVTSGLERLQTDSGEVRAEIDSKQLETLPLPADRNYESLLLLVPGITPPANAQSVASNPTRGLQFNTNGAMANTNNVRIDGATAINVWLPNVAAYNPGAEAIASVTVVTNAFDAQLGLAGGASVNVHIKTGTNQFHGSAFWFHSDNALTAKPFFLPRGQTRNPKNVDNYAGGSIGGPVWRDHLFFFQSYERHTTYQESLVFSTVPTDGLKNGDFSASSSPIYEPGTGTSSGADKTPFPGNFIPVSQRDPIALQIQQHIPSANLPGTSNNYASIGPYDLDTSKYDTNVTYQATKKLNLGARMGIVVVSAFDSPAYGDNGQPVSSAGGRAGATDGKVLNATGSASYVFTPNFVMDGYVGATKIWTANLPSEYGQNVGLNFGIPNTNGPTIEYSGWPYFSISNFSPVGTNEGTIKYADGEYHSQAAFNWTHTSHSVRFGATLSHQTIRHFQTNSAVPAGVFDFTGSGTSEAGGPGANLYNAYADFLLGLFSSGTSDFLPDDNHVVGKTWIYSLFAQDQWLVSKNVTLSYGIRWDYFPIGGREGRGFERYIPATNMTELCGVAGNSHTCGSEVSKLNFSPDFGISMKLSGTMVLRAGAGINMDPYPLAFNRDLVSNFPEDLTNTQTPANSLVAPFTLEQGLLPIATFNTSTGSVSVPNTYTTISLPDHPRRSYVETWNVGVQKLWRGDITSEVRYVGLRQLEIPSLLNENAGVIGKGQAGEPLNVAPFFRTASTEVATPVGRNQYDALQAQVLKRFTARYSINLGYTWSKAFDYCCDTVAGETVEIQAPGYLNLNRGLAPFDRTYVFTASGNAVLPFGKGQSLATHGIWSAIFGGFSLNGIFAAYSGTPFSIESASNGLNAPGSIQLADRVRSGRCTFGAHNGLNGGSYVDTSCFAPVPSTAVRFGTSSFGTVRGPGVKNLNASLFRTQQLTSSTSLEFRAEVFNVTNTPHFNNPGSLLNISNISYNANGTINNLNGFGAITSTNSRDQEGIDQRQIRLGARFVF